MGRGRLAAASLPPTTSAQGRRKRERARITEASGSLLVPREPRRLEKEGSQMGRRLVLAVAVLVLGPFLLSLAAVAQVPGTLVIKTLVDKKALQLPDGPIFWRI